MAIGRIRAFISVDIEDPVVVSRIARIRDSFIATGAPMKPVEDKNFHVTIRFLGEIPVTLIDDIERVIAESKPRRTRLVLEGVGAFPSLSRPRVLWVGISKGSDELERIHSVIERGLRRLGFRAEREEFVAHVTFARLKGGRNIDRVVKLLNELSGVEVGEVELSSVRLKQSILTRSGPIYKTIREVVAT